MNEDEQSSRNLTIRLVSRLQPQLAKGAGAAPDIPMDALG
jgi:hypothetical protein